MIDFLLKPGTYVVLIFWFMYISSLVYYSGRDRRRRYNMTKSQNRDDLAEIKDKEVQCIQDVIKEIVARDHARKVKNTYGEKFGSSTTLLNGAIISGNSALKLDDLHLETHMHSVDKKGEENVGFLQIPKQKK